MGQLGIWWGMGWQDYCGGWIDWEDVWVLAH